MTLSSKAAAGGNRSTRGLSWRFLRTLDSPASRPRRGELLSRAVADRVALPSPTHPERREMEAALVA